MSVPTHKGEATKDHTSGHEDCCDERDVHEHALLSAEVGGGALVDGGRATEYALRGLTVVSQFTPLSYEVQVHHPN
jgi:hypothetical protein